MEVVTDLLQIQIVYTRNRILGLISVYYFNFCVSVRIASLYAISCRQLCASRGQGVMSQAHDLQTFWNIIYDALEASSLCTHH